MTSFLFSFPLFIASIAAPAGSVDADINDEWIQPAEFVPK